MITTLDSIDTVYYHLSASPVKEIITGGIYKIVRPTDSIKNKLEDIVINCLGMPNRDLQHGVVNINIHVPNLELLINGRPDNTQPDIERLKLISDTVLHAVNDVYALNYSFQFQQQNWVEGENGESVLNIRLDFYSINL